MNGHQKALSERLQNQENLHVCFLCPSCCMWTTFCPYQETPHQLKQAASNQHFAFWSKGASQNRPRKWRCSALCTSQPPSQSLKSRFSSCSPWHTKGATSSLRCHSPRHADVRQGLAPRQNIRNCAWEAEESYSTKGIFCVSVFVFFLFFSNEAGNKTSQPCKHTKTCCRQVEVKEQAPCQMLLSFQDWAGSSCTHFFP